MKILLVEPAFPISPKSKNHKNFLPIGLLKISSYLQSNGNEVELVRGTPKKLDDWQISNFNPQEVWITSLFTYWAEYVKEAVQYYKHLFPEAKIKVGGIYASLMPEHCKRYTGCDEVHQGTLEEAEDFFPDYGKAENANPSAIDYQIVHASRGCKRKCPFCGVWKIEPEFIPKKSIKDEIEYRKVVFYDNNFLMNPYVEDILDELIQLKEERTILWCESQSGFDGRILLQKPHLAEKIKEAGFRYPRIAWDWGMEDAQSLREQIDLLIEAGYNPKDIFIFMLYNWNIPFDEMEEKRIQCWDWDVQISDCRYRPLDQTYDNYSPNAKDQTSEDYYIHEDKGWADALIKQFRRNIRRQNICVRYGFPFYSKGFEHKEFGKEIRRNVKNIGDLEGKIAYLKDVGADYWLPGEKHFPPNV